MAAFGYPQLITPLADFTFRLNNDKLIARLASTGDG
jgi:hypothetical protein